MDWRDVCRLCAANFELNHKVFDTSPELSQIILKHLSITIKNDNGLSTKVCYKCEEKVMDFHNFSKECERIQYMFIGYKNFDTIANQNFKLERCTDIPIKEEYKCDYDDIEYYENCNDFIEPIKVENTDKDQVGNKRKYTRIKKEKTYSLRLIRYDCHVCKLEFKNWKTLNLHTKEEHDANPQINCICSKILNNYRSVLRHEKKHNPTKCFGCESCSKTFSSRMELANHANTHLPKADLPYVCCKCAKRFSNPKSLIIHEKIHLPRSERPKLPCDLCDKKLVSKNALLLHVRTVHEKLRPYMCDLCGRSFTTKANFIDHRVIHSSEKNFKCEKCDKKFKTKTCLLRHQDTHSDTAYQCPHCPMLLNSRKTLRNHLYVHDECMNVMCSMCGRRFKRKKDLKSHMKQHTGERPYTCTWCPRTFSSKSNCRIHKKRKHPIDFHMEEKTNPFAPVTDGKKEVPKKIIHTTIKVHPVPLKLDSTNETNRLNEEKKTGLV